MDYNNEFSTILDNDEQIIESFKPNKKRFVVFGALKDILGGLIALIFVAIVILIMIFGESEDGSSGALPLIFVGAFGLIVVLCTAFSVIRKAVIYKKTVYCYTNKRILIRSGFIGADFQMLDYKMIGAMDVRVDLIDKFVKPNPGSIIFASSASPMLMGMQTRAARNGELGYVFAYIDNPYDVYKRIKEYMSMNKEENK